jgi:lysophospholipase L1-like esterase
VIHLSGRILVSCKTLVLLLAATLMLRADAGAPPALDLVYIGDSITAGATLSDAATQAPPVICSQAIQAKLKDESVYFSNQGHGGHTTVDFLPSSARDFPGLELAARKLLSDHPGKLVFSIMLGTNDSAVTGPRGAPVSPENYGKNLTTIMDQLLADFPGSEVFIQQPIWYSPNTHNHSTYEQAGLDRLNSYFPVIQAVVAAEAGVHKGQVHAGDTAAYAYFEANGVKELHAETGVEGTFYLHPNVIGATSLGNFWANAILAGLAQNP